jgi:hypothetical protein
MRIDLQQGTSCGREYPMPGNFVENGNGAEPGKVSAAPLLTSPSGRLTGQRIISWVRCPVA